MGTLDGSNENNITRVSKVLRITLPRTNPNIKADIDAELADGWRYQSMTHFNDGSDRLLVIFTRPKKN
jgi:hypothetical protein